MYINSLDSTPQCALDRQLDWGGVQYGGRLFHHAVYVYLLAVYVCAVFGISVRREWVCEGRICGRGHLIRETNVRFAWYRWCC